MTTIVKRTLILVVLISGFLIRLLYIGRPLADWHSWRQADTASVAREYIKQGIDILRPKYHDVSSIPSGRENPMGFRMVEFPMVSVLVAVMYQIFQINFIPIHVLYRLVNVCLSMLSAVFLYKIVRFYESSKLALLVMGVFLFLPFNIYYSRTVLPEVALVTCFLAVYWCGLFNKGLGLVISMSLALLLKPTAIFFILPSVLISRQKKIWLFALFVGIFGLALWRGWIGNFPEGIPASNWLFNGNGIRFKGSWWQWLFGDRLGRLILGYWGLIPFGIGLMANKHSRVFSGWLVCSFIYLVVLATGNVQHDYYQVPLIPIVAVITGYGLNWLLINRKYVMLLMTVLFSLAFGWYQVRGLYNINNQAIVEAGEYVNKNVEENALVIAPYGGDTAFLYQTNRRGWPIGGNVEEKIKMGARYYVTVVFDDEMEDLVAKYRLINRTDKYVVLKLK